MSSLYDKEILCFDAEISKEDYISSYVSYCKCMGHLKSSMIKIFFAALLIAASILYLTVNFKVIDHNLIVPYIVICLFCGYIIYDVSVKKVKKAIIAASDCYDKSSLLKDKYKIKLFKGHIEFSGENSSGNISYADMKGLVENKTEFVLVSEMCSPMLIIPKRCIEETSINMVQECLRYGFVNRRFEVK